MKKLILSTLGLLLLSLGSYAQFCYSPNWTEPSLDSMLIYVSVATLDGTNLQAGDAIGVFDGTECVGLGVLSGELTGAPTYLVIETSRDNPVSIPIDGFFNGNPISFRFCSGGEVINPAVLPTFVTNGPNFAINDSCIVELRAVNTAPIVTSIPDTVATEDLPYSSFITAMDIDGDELTFSAPVALPAWLLFDVDSQELSGNPGNDEVGFHSVTLRISDGTDDVDTTFSIRVANENDAPTYTFTPDTVATQDLLYSSTVTAEDIDVGDTLVYSATDLPSWLLFDVPTQVLSGTPGNDDVGDHNVTLRIFDGTVNVDSSFVIHVGNVNDPPTFSSVPDTMALEDVLYTSSLAAVDADGDTLTFFAPLLPAWLLFDADTQVLSGTPDNADVGDHDVTLRVNDGTINVDTSFVIHVGNQNDAPTFSSVPDTMALEDVLYSSSLVAEDIDFEDTLTFSAPLLPSWLLFDVDTQVLSGTPDNDDVGDHDVTLRVNDGTVNVDTSFVIHVGNVNDLPTFSSVPDTMALEDVLYTSSLTAVDVDRDTLTFFAPLLPAWLLFDADTQVLSGTPDNDDVGDHDVTLRVNDGTVNVDTSFVIHVENANDAPTFTSLPDTTALQGTPYSYTATAEDIDLGDTLSFSAPVLPLWLNFDVSTHILSGTPGNDHVGDHDVILLVNDGTEDVIQSFVIHVENINDPPTITSVPLTEARPGVSYSYTIIAEDIDGDDLNYTALVLPGWLGFNASTHILSATPGDEDIGDQHVTIRVSDGSLYTDQIFVITVGYGNHAPTFTSDPATSVVMGNAYVYTVTANDIDSDPLSYSAPVLPGWLTFYPDTHVISGVPGSGDLGRHDVTLRVSDGTVSADQSFPIFVENVNNTPYFTSSPVTSVLAGDLYVYTATADDLDGDVLTFSAPTLPDWLSFDINTHILHGTPGNDVAGDHNVTLKISDGEEEENQNFVVNVEFVSGIRLDDFHSPDFLVVYPNPSDGLFFVELSRELESEVTLAILNPIGKVILQESFPPYILINQEYNLNDLPAGMYFISLYNNSFQTTRKLVIR